MDVLGIPRHAVLQYRWDYRLHRRRIGLLRALNFSCYIQGLPKTRICWVLAFWGRYMDI